MRNGRTAKLARQKSALARLEKNPRKTMSQYLGKKELDADWARIDREIETLKLRIAGQ